VCQHGKRSIIKSLAPVSVQAARVIYLQLERREKEKYIRVTHQRLSVLSFPKTLRINCINFHLHLSFYNLFVFTSHSYHPFQTSKPTNNNGIHHLPSPPLAPRRSQNAPTHPRPPKRQPQHPLPFPAGSIANPTFPAPGARDPRRRRQTLVHDLGRGNAIRATGRKECDWDSDGGGSGV
jgi:hypothetical protein